jgi:protein-S-isoprenylcysteine O-methyltransferase Ste14
MIQLDLLRTYLILGMLAHKLVWEVLKRRPSSKTAKPATALSVKVVKAVKVAILLALFAQTLLPDILPISSQPGILRLTGATLFTVGLAMAMTARLQLGRNWSDIENAGVLSGQVVVGEGLYRFVRHPIYAGDLLLLVGMQLALNSWCVLLAVLFVPVVFRKAVQEERMLIRKLPGYEAYCRRTKRFVPFVA